KPVICWAASQLPSFLICAFSFHSITCLARPDPVPGSCCQNCSVLNKSCDQDRSSLALSAARVSGIPIAITQRVKGCLRARLNRCHSCALLLFAIPGVFCNCSGVNKSQEKICSKR